MSCRARSGICSPDPAGKLYPSRACSGSPRRSPRAKPRIAARCASRSNRRLPLRRAARTHGARCVPGDVFARLRVWDTEANNGVLIYLLLADHRIEIVADRGVAARVDRARSGARSAR